MIHMGSDHRCVMVTFTITSPGKSSHCKTIEGKHDMTKHEGRDQTGKNIEVEKPEKRYQEIIEKIKKKNRRHKKKAAAQADSENAEKTEAEAEEVGGTCTAWRRQEMQVEDILDFTQ